MEVIAGADGACKSCGIGDAVGGDSWRIRLVIVGCGTSNSPAGRITRGKEYIWFYKLYVD